MKILLVRHAKAGNNRAPGEGESAHTLPEPEPGEPLDAPSGHRALLQETDFRLNRLGDRQADRCGLALARQILDKWGIAPSAIQILSSSFTRARQTANAIIDRLDEGGARLAPEQINVSGRLGELDMAHHKRLPSATLQAWTARLAKEGARILPKRFRGYHPMLVDQARPSQMRGHYPGAEGMDGVEARLCEEMAQFLAHSRNQRAEVGIIVTHALTAHPLRALLCGLKRETMAGVPVQDNASAYLVEIDDRVVDRLLKDMPRGDEGIDAAYLGLGMFRDVGYLHGGPSTHSRIPLKR